MQASLVLAVLLQQVAISPPNMGRRYEGAGGVARSRCGFRRTQPDKTRERSGDWAVCTKHAHFPLHASTGESLGRRSKQTEDQKLVVEH